MKILSSLLLTILASISPLAVHASCHCEPPLQGPEGPPGTSDFLNTFGSFYTYESDLGLDSNDPIPIELVNSNVNLIQIPNYQVQIVETGYYFLIMGGSNDGFDGAEVALFVNGSEITGTELYLPLQMKKMNSLSMIIPLNAGDIIEIRSLADDWLLGTGVYDDVTAYLTLIKVGS